LPRNSKPDWRLLELTVRLDAHLLFDSKFSSQTRLKTQTQLNQPYSSPTNRRLAPLIPHFWYSCLEIECGITSCGGGLPNSSDLVRRLLLSPGVEGGLQGVGLGSHEAGSPKQRPGPCSLHGFAKVRPGETPQQDGVRPNGIRSLRKAVKLKVHQTVVAHVGQQVSLACPSKQAVSLRKARFSRRRLQKIACASFDRRPIIGVSYQPNVFAGMAKPEPLQNGVLGIFFGFQPLPMGTSLEIGFYPIGSPQYRLVRGFCPFPREAGTLTIPWFALSQRATYTWTNLGESVGDWKSDLSVWAGLGNRQKCPSKHSRGSRKKAGEMRMAFFFKRVHGWPFP
jgi:hypothetical protein